MDLLSLIHPDMPQLLIRELGRARVTPWILEGLLLHGPALDGGAEVDVLEGGDLQISLGGLEGFDLSSHALDKILEILDLAL